MHKPKQESLSIFYPFVFSEDINPSHIVTVGDQVVAEHIYAFHAKENVKKGFSSIVSNIEFDYEKSQIIISPKDFQLKKNDGSIVTFDDFCKSVISNLNGTQHVIIKPLVKSVECKNNTIKINLTSIPVNAKYLFTLADFSIYNHDQTIRKDHLFATSGPYFARSISPKLIQLEINPFYPKSLRANEIKNINLISYDNSRVNEFINDLKPNNIDLAYIYGYFLSEAKISLIEKQGYNVKEMPSEWLIYVGLNNSVNKNDRMRISQLFDINRLHLLKIATLGQAAYSLSPQDRPFGLKHDEYVNLIQSTPKEFSIKKNKKKYVFATLDEWAETPIFKAALELVKTELHDICEIKLFSRKDISTLWSESVDLVISPIGIAPADPISNIFFMTEFRDLISENEILQASITHDPNLFNQQIKKLESRMIHEHRFLPIGHFPGIVVSKQNITENEELAWSWGIQAWTLNID